jgi:hypothetical protein
MAAAYGIGLFESITRLEEQLVGIGRSLSIECSMQHPRTRLPSKVVIDLRRLIVQLSQFPGENAREWVLDVLMSDVLDQSSFSSVLLHLVRWPSIPDQSVLVQAAKQQLQDASRLSWSESHWATRSICRSMFECEFPIMQTSAVSFADVLQLWKSVDDIWSIAGSLGDMRSRQARTSLYAIVADPDAPPDLKTAMGFKIAANVKNEEFPRFLEFVASGQGFDWVYREEQLRAATTALLPHLKSGLFSKDDLVRACHAAASEQLDIFLDVVLQRAGESLQERTGYVLHALKHGRRSGRIIEAMFWHREPLDQEGQYRIVPRANNGLRQALFETAQGATPAATQGKDFLAGLECERRERGRPADEPVHPSVTTDLTAWTRVLN